MFHSKIVEIDIFKLNHLIKKKQKSEHFCKICDSPMGGMSKWTKNNNRWDYFCIYNTSYFLRTAQALFL